MVIAIDDALALLEVTKLVKNFKDNILRKHPIDSVIDQVFKEIKDDDKYSDWVTMLDEIEESKKDLFINIDIVEKDEFNRKLNGLLETEVLDWFYDDFKKRYKKKLFEYASKDIEIFKPYMVDKVNGIEAEIRYLHEILQETLREYRNSKDCNEEKEKLLEVYIDQFDRIYGTLCNLQKDTSVEYAKNIFNHFSTFENLAYYIDLKCYEDEHHDIVLIDKYVEKWLGEKNYPILVILGDFGTGKTTYVTNLIKQFADRYVKDNDFYLPISVQLKNFTKFWNLEDLIKNYNILYGLSINDFENKFRQGKILFVFDGYDELPKGTVEKFNEVNSLVSARNKVIITSRTHYFENKEDEELSLDPESMDFTGISLKDKSKVKIVYISLFSENDIKRYLKRYFGVNWFARYETINKIYNLSDLSKRPILLNLIVQTLSDFSLTTGEITQSKLYDTYVNKWMNREKRKVNPKYVSVVMEELAFKMFTENKNVITIDEIYETVDRKFRADIMKGRVDIDDINKKIRTASFIYRDSEDNFVFMHRSFMEFFIAKKLSQEINEDIIDSNILRKKMLTPEIISFIKEMINNKSSLFLSMIEYTRGKTENETGFLGGNAVTLLKYLSYDFRESDFSLTVLSGADLSNCDLSNTCFRKTIMRNVKLSNSILRFTDFSESCLKRADIEKANIKGANFEKANLEGAKLREACLKKTNLSGVNLERANLFWSDLSWVNLHSANLIGANLERAYLIEANLEGAILEGANLEGAVLEGANIYANLEEANLEGANLEKSNLKEAYLNKANLIGASLIGATLEAANLKKSNLKEANIKEANLEWADLERANLEKANLERTSLFKAILYWTNFSEANLSRAIFYWANLEGANFEGANLEGAKF